MIERLLAADGALARDELDHAERLFEQVAEILGAEVSSHRRRLLCWGVELARGAADDSRLGC